MIERRKGTIQHQRKNENLVHQNFKIDDRSFEHLLSYITSYAAYINFYNTVNSVDGNWSVLLAHDPIIYMTMIVKEPVDSLIVLESKKDTVKTLLDWYTKIEKWGADLLSLKEDILSNKIGNIISDVLHYQKSELLEYIKNIKEEKPESDAPEKATGLYSKPPPIKKKEIDLHETVYTVKKIIFHIQNFVKRHLRNNIFGRDNHLPNNALYITFALLYQKLQGQINTLSKRHLDFYYKDVLQQTLSDPIPTETVLCFETTLGARSIVVPEGTQFTAGKLFGGKKEVFFETNKSILIHPVVLVSLRTLYFNKSKYIQIGTNDLIISNIISNHLIDKTKKIENAEKWSLFGADQDTLINSAITSTTITNIGFMIGSPVLFLQEGKREINLTFTLEEHSAKHIFWKLLAQMVTNQCLPLDVVFNMVFEKAFIISYTSIKGWETISSYELSFHEGDNTFTVSVLLENMAPPITELTSEKKHSVWPMIRLVFDEYAPIYAYSFFKGVQLDAITIDVKVSEIKNLALYTNIGKMPLTKSFDMFGPLPKKGSYLMIGKSELFKKELSNLTIHIDWEATPMDDGGFDTYYNEYSEEFTNDSFKVEIQGLSNGYWFPHNEELLEKQNLYTVENCMTAEGYDSNMIASKRSFYIDELGPYKFSRNYTLQDPLKDTIHTQGGFLKLTLASPPYAFGQEVYQKNYTEIATYNAKNNEGLALPNKPFVPRVKTITVDYEAKDVIYLNRFFSTNEDSDALAGDFVHIAPFGTEKIVSNNKIYKNIIVPDFEGEGYLYFGLSGITAGIGVSLFFDLQNHTPINNTRNENITIQYKEGNNWVSLTQKHIISDTTNKLMKSGIIELTFPNHVVINKDEVFELRCIAQLEAYMYPIIKGIYINAVTVACITDDIAVIGKKVPAYSLIKPVKKIPQLKKIIQPIDSYGGKLPGDQALFYTEISERIRHKDRAVTIWDYERLVLYYFPDVIAAKCTNLDSNFKPQAGKIKLIVLSTKWKNQNHHYFNTNELSQIAKLIQNKANSFSKIQVQNPEVESLLVNCLVAFYEEDNGGYYINELNKVVSNYLCPMPVEGHNPVEGIGVTVEPRMLVSYIENLPYIQSVEKLNIEHIVKNGINDFTMKVFKENEIIKPTKPWSILAPVTKHNIYLSVSTEKEESQADVDMLDLQVGVDFIIEGDDDTKMDESISSPQPTIEKEVAPKKAILPDKKSDTILTFKIE